MAHRHADGPAVAGQALHQIAADESGAAEDRHDAAHTRPSRPLSTSRPPRQAPGRRIYTKPGLKLTASIDCLFLVAGADSDASPSIRATRPPRPEPLDRVTSRKHRSAPRRESVVQDV